MPSLPLELFSEEIPAVMQKAGDNVTDQLTNTGWINMNVRITSIAKKILVTSTFFAAAGFLCLSFTAQKAFALGGDDSWRQCSEDKNCVAVSVPCGWEPANTEHASQLEAEAAKRVLPGMTIMCAQSPYGDSPPVAKCSPQMQCILLPKDK